MKKISNICKKTGLYFLLFSIIINTVSYKSMSLAVSYGTSAAEEAATEEAATEETEQAAKEPLPELQKEEPASQEELTADEASKTEAPVTEEEQEAEDTHTDISRVQNVYEGNGYSVIFHVDDMWSDGYNATVTIANTGEEMIENWYVAFELSNEISNIWNAHIDTNEEGVYLIKNAGWNQDIPVAGSVSFGFTAKGTVSQLPDYFSLPGRMVELSSDDYSVEYVITEDWIEGYNAQITVTNHTDKALEDWRIAFDYDNIITDIWNASIKKQEGSHYLIVNQVYNSKIAPHDTVSFGFKVEQGLSDVLPEHIRVEEIRPEEHSVDEDALLFLDGEMNVGGNALELFMYSVYEAFDYNIYLMEEDGSEPVLAAVSEEAEYSMDLSERTASFFCYAAQDTDEGELVSNWLSVRYIDGRFELDNTDTDGDGLTDDFERFIGTDTENTDTDNDGLSDEYEYYELGTDPLSADTDGNGRNDGEEDFDSDQLTNVEEMNHGTDSYNADTDGDRLSDYEELYTYGTDPFDADTDSDYMEDGDEIAFGQNPLEEDSNHNGIEDGYEVYTVKMDSEQIENDGVICPSLEMKMEGCYIPSLFITQIDSTDECLNEEIPGYIGSAYDFNVSDQIRDNLEAEITYEFDEKLLKEEDFVPMIYYLNEETMCLEKVENQTIQGNSVTASVAHFSIYILLNSKKFDSIWNMSLGGMNAIELVLDGSGSMSWNDPDNIRYSCADSMLDSMGSRDQAAIIGFDRTAKVLQSFTRDKAAAKKAVRRTFTDGGTNICNAIQTGINEFQKADSNAGKCMVLLTDGSSTTSGIDSLLAEAKKNGIKIYTIGLGEEVNTAFLKKIARVTQGEYYFASAAEELPVIFDDIQQVGGAASGASSSSWRYKSALAKVVDKAGFRYVTDKDIITSKVAPHQKDYGFTYVYDNLCIYMDMNIDCEPIYFFYGGKEYMIEFWKGQYGAETGGEIGIYYREPGPARKGEKSTGKWYKANYPQLWDMKLSLKQNGGEVFNRSGDHWWLTGFKWGRYTSSPSSLSMTATITFSSNSFANAFVTGYGNASKDKENWKDACKKTNRNNYDNSDDGKYGLKARGYGPSDYRISDSTVTVFFKKARCKQPKLMVQRRNTVRKRTKYNTLAYRAVRCICNNTKDKKAHPNDPNNFDISFCKKLDSKKVKNVVAAIYSEGSDVYNQFLSFIKKQNPKLGRKLEQSVKNSSWSGWTDKDFKKLAKLICKYYDKAYKIMQNAPAKLVDKVMEKAGEAVKGVYQ